MGGDGQTYFYCSGRCGTRDLCLPCSGTHKESKQSFCFASGVHLFRGKLCPVWSSFRLNGDEPCTWLWYNNVVRGPYRDGQCEVAKQEMKKAPPDEIGSWQRAVTVADGAWMTRGHHSSMSVITWGIVLYPLLSTWKEAPVCRYFKVNGRCCGRDNISENEGGRDGCKMALARCWLYIW